MEKFPPGENILWVDPGDVSSLDLAMGVGGRDMQPQPPFTLIREDLSGSNPKILVSDGKGRKWSVKWSEEAHSDVFGSRMAWACGFIAQPEYFVPSGLISGIHARLKRAQAVIQENGEFRSARFQLRSEEPRFLTSVGWSWVNNPFRGTAQLNGLRVLMMLLSDWDNKDARDKARDSNLAIFEAKGADGPRYLYFVADWGGSMGKWGKVATRDKWDPRGFASQTPEFIKGTHGGIIDWGYVGQRTSDQVTGIRVSDVAWLLGYLGRITDDQIRSALDASGATHEETEAFTASLRNRIGQLQRAAQVYSSAR